MAFLALLLLPFRGNGQINLVPNPSFEVYSGCPDGSGQINKAIPWYGEPKNSSTDYFNACVTATNGPGVPSGGGGFQYPYSGNAYAGIWLYDAGVSYREYLQVELIDTLKNNHCYYVEFYANRANWISIACNGLAAHFSKDSLLIADSNNILNVSSQIELYKNPIIKDTLNWVKIAGFYTSSGKEKYITIGNFGSDSNTNTAKAGGTFDFGAYYYIDDVKVIEVDNSFMPFWTYKDTTINKGDSVYIGTRINGLNCTWYQNGTQIADSVPGLYVKPTVTTSYTVVQRIPCSKEAATTHAVVVTVLNNVGITEQSREADIKLYPNPSKSEIVFISLPFGKRAYAYSLFDIQGRELQQGPVELLNQSTATINVALLHAGIYFVHITYTATSETITRKLVIQK